MVFNKGAAFGILNDRPGILTVISLVFILLITLFLVRDRRRSGMINLAYGLIIGGALSNLFDRIVYGYVIDYLDFRVWPVFNVSDTCITVGVGMILCQTIFTGRDEKNCRS